MKKDMICYVKKIDYDLLEDKNLNNLNFSHKIFLLFLFQVERI